VQEGSRAFPGRASALFALVRRAGKPEVEGPCVSSVVLISSKPQ